MQRLLSLATLGLILGGGVIFLRDSPPSGTVPVQPTAAAPGVGGGYAGQSAAPRQHLPPGNPPAGYYSQTNGPAIQPPAIGPAAGAGAGGAAVPPIRIASFNIEVFGAAKEKNLPVMQTLAAIMRNFEIIAIQEIRIKDDYFLRRFLSEYLNRLSGRQYDYIVGPRLGRTISKEQYAFIYDTDRIEVNRNHIYTVSDPHDLLHREPLVAMFRARGPPSQQAFTFVLVNIHTDPDEVETELNALSQVYHRVRGAAAGEDDIILVGDFNTDDRRMGELGRIPGVSTLITGVFTNTRQTQMYDNLILHGASTIEYTGRAGVYDIQRYHNLTMDQALQVSDHLPVWAEFHAFEGTNSGRVAARPGYRN